MKITFISPSPNAAGGNRVIAIYAERLARRGHDVCIVSMGPPRQALRHRLKSLLTGRGWPRVPRRGPSHFDRLELEWRTLKDYRPVSDDDVPDADVVVATWWKTAPWVAALSPSKGAKAYFMQDYGVPGMALEQIVPTWSLPLHIITISQWLRDLISEHVDSPVDLVPNSVDTELFYAPPRGKENIPTIGFVYLPYWSKGADLCVAAAEQARQRVGDLRLVGFGKRPHARFPLPPWAELRHGAQDAELREIYACCDAWMFGSRLEGFGLPILEAMACRTPVLATKAGSAPELLVRGGGMLVQPAHPIAMAAAIERVCAMSDAEWREMSDSAYATATGYTWDDATDLFERALRKAIERRKGPAVSVPLGGKT